MSRSLNVASALLFILGVWLSIFGVWALFLSEGHLSTSMTFLNERLRAAPTFSQIRDFSQNLLDFMTYLNRWFGLYRMSFGLFFCVTALIPYRKGEKWAWYAMLVIGGINMFGTLALTYIGLEVSSAGGNITSFILWIVGLALPAKEILGKPS